MSNVMLDVRDLTTKYITRYKESIYAVDHVSLKIEEGKSLGIAGESGCGKSTLARTLMMLEWPDVGTVAWDGTDPYRLKGKDLLALRRKVQMVFQDPYASLNARMNAAEIISEPWRTHRDLYPRKRDRAARVRAISLSTCSGWMK